MQWLTNLPRIVESGDADEGGANVATKDSGFDEKLYDTPPLLGDDDEIELLDEPVAHTSPQVEVPPEESRDYGDEDDDEEED
jgi:hypothetical protein